MSGQVQQSGKHPKVLPRPAGKTRVRDRLSRPRFQMLPSSYWMASGVIVLMLLLLFSCQTDSQDDSAREILNAEVDALQLPYGSSVLARSDGIGGGQIPECAGAVTELILGNSISQQDVYAFYRRDLLSRGWRIRSEDAHGVALSRDERTGIEISDSYYSSTAASHEQIKKWEQEYHSLVYINIGRSFRDPVECERALQRVGK